MIAAIIVHQTGAFEATEDLVEDIRNRQNHHAENTSDDDLPPPDTRKERPSNAENFREDPYAPFDQIDSLESQKRNADKRRKKAMRLGVHGVKEPGVEDDTRSERRAKNKTNRFGGISLGDILDEFGDN